MIELRRLQSRLSLSPSRWMLTLEIARVCGWKPIGTNRAEELDVRHLVRWQTEYMCNDGQTIEGADATQLADALSRAISEGDRILTDWTAGRITPPEDVRTEAGGFRWFSTAEGKDHLRNIANFCRGGAFQIF